MKPLMILAVLSLFIIATSAVPPAALGSIVALKQNINGNAVPPLLGTLAGSQKVRITRASPLLVASLAGSPKVRITRALPPVIATLAGSSKVRRAAATPSKDLEGAESVFLTNPNYYPIGSYAFVG